MSDLTAFVLSQVKAILKAPLEELGKVGTGKFQNALKKWKNNANLTSLARKIGQVENVKTLWNIEKEVSLYSFYYPTRLQVGEAPPKTIRSLSDFGEPQNYVIQGTVGQGKSIFLRYLCGQELRPKTSTGRIPIFAELRRIHDQTDLKEIIFDAFRRLGFDIDDALFEFYARSGKIVLLLDAFDEIEQRSVGRTVADLEGLAARFPELQIVVTSRPDSGIQNSSFFRVVRLTPLSPSDHLPFLKVVCENADQAKALHEAIKSSKTEVRDLIKTPLLMTLLVVLYKGTGTVPDTVPGFYEQLFDTLFFRHDRSKPGFTRKRFTSLEDAKIKALFEAFCFQVRLAAHGVITTEKFRESLNKAMRLVGLEVDTEQFKNEIVKTTCLMQEEGFDIAFVHKSVAEFHAAAFVRHSSDAVAERFYAAILDEDLWHAWQQELRFLADIDSYRFSRYFLIPSIEEALSGLKIRDANNIDEDRARDFANEISLKVRIEKDGAAGFIWGFRFPGKRHYSVHTFIYSWVHTLLGLSAIRDVDMLSTEIRRIKTNRPTRIQRDLNDVLELRLSDLFESPRLRAMIMSSFRNAAKRLLHDLSAAQERVRRETDKLVLMATLTSSSQ